MFDKVLVGIGILLGSILFIENMVSGYQAYLFLDTGASSGSVVFVSILIGIGIGIGIKGLMNNKKDLEEDDDYNF